MSRGLNPAPSQNHCNFFFIRSMNFRHLLICCKTLFVGRGVRKRDGVEASDILPLPPIDVFTKKKKIGFFSLVKIVQVRGSMGVVKFPKLDLFFISENRAGGRINEVGG